MADLDRIDQLKRELSNHKRFLSALQDKDLVKEMVKELEPLVVELALLTNYTGEPK